MSPPLPNDEPALHELAQRGIRLPAQPEVLLEVGRALRSEDFNVRKLAGLISRDAGLAALLFRVARSPAFYRGHTPDTLEEVLVRLGSRQTLNLMRAAALSSAIPDHNRRALELFWQRSREIALLAALVAEDRVSVCNIFADQAYIAGIFLECGVPVLMQRFPDYCASLNLYQDLDAPSLREEDRRFNVDHGSIGYLVARHWGLPDFIALAILHSNEIPREDHGAVRSLVAILQLALYAQRRAHQRVSTTWHLVSKDVLAELGIHPDELEDYVDDLLQGLASRGI